MQPAPLPESRAQLLFPGSEYVAARMSRVCLVNTMELFLKLPPQTCPKAHFNDNHSS